MSTLNRLSYRNMISSMNQSKIGVSPNKAKPYLLLSIIDGISQKIISDNKILFEDVVLLYQERIKSAKETVARIVYPFYFLASDGFYHLQWNGNPVKTKSPSAKFIRAHIDFAYLDNALWDLLQDVEVRQEYKELIENHYLT